MEDDGFLDLDDGYQIEVATSCWLGLLPQLLFKVATLNEVLSGQMDICQRWQPRVMFVLMMDSLMEVATLIDGYAQRKHDGILLKMATYNID